MFFRSWYHRIGRKRPLAHEWVTNYSQNIPSLPTITWIGHSTFLIQIDGITILTDPIFGDASFLFKRIFPPGIALDTVIPDYILLSHNHRDHMDATSLLQLRHHNPHILVPAGDKKWFVHRNFERVEEKTWWQSTTINHNKSDLTFTFLPAHHWSQRSLFDRNKSLWGSWMIQYKGFTIYFAGDTAYSSHFTAIKREFPFIDVALMPIGPCEPRNSMAYSHMNAEQAGQAFIDLGAKNFIPMHWGTFYFGIDNFSQPLDRLFAWWQQQPQLDMKQLQILKIGQQWLVPLEEHMSIVDAPQSVVSAGVTLP